MSSRAHETRIEIDVPIEEVWKAITDPKELSRWFAPKMTVEPGAGGFVLADWGPGLEWKTAIEVWEPNRHLRLVETRDRVMGASPDEEPLPPCTLVQDFYLETEGGKTVLRLVHSGFGSSADWDSEYEGTRTGWAACFLRMKEGLERHRGDSVHNFIVTAQCYDMVPERALELVESAAPQPLRIVMRSELHFTARLEDLNGSILTASVQPARSGSMVYVESLLFGVEDAQASNLETYWMARLQQLFPAKVRPDKVLCG
jgi:uncharacterized protein YndB with AHSA1/START domain